VEPGLPEIANNWSGLPLAVRNFDVILDWTWT